MISSFLSVLTACSLAAQGVQAAAHDHIGHAREHHEHVLLPGKWYHEDSHPAHALFRRADETFPPIGSEAWSAGFPKYGSPDSTPLPKAWTDALAAGIAAGKIPTLPQTTVKTGENPVYPNGLQGTDPTVCSGTYECRIKGTIWDAPAGVLGVGFDDGPQPDSTTLSAFLKKNNQKATRFLIGNNILAYPKEFETMINNGDDLAVHTWSHPYMTSQTNNQVLAQLGWTAYLIRNSTGGKLPKYWRPPYGDSDMRTTSIAKEVFGMTALHWNQNTNDYEIAGGGITAAAVAKLFDGWLKGPKTPGLVILEHETSPQSVTAFMDAYPSFKTNGWKAVSQAQMFATDNSGTGTGNTSMPSSSAVTLTSSSKSGKSQSTSASASTSSSSSPASSSAVSHFHITSAALLSMILGLLTVSYVL